MSGQTKRRKPNVFDVIVLSFCIHWVLLYGISKTISEPGQLTLVEDSETPKTPVPVAVNPPSEFLKRPRR